MLELPSDLIQARPPQLFRVRQEFDRPRVADLEAAVLAELNRPEVAATISGVERVAVAVGSRGIAGIDRTVRSLVNGLRAGGIETFIVPAMGSHGGATADGQERVLTHLGITEERIGAPIRSGMDVVEIGSVVSPRGHTVPVYMDAVACNEADAVIPVNRIKPHTGFRGPVESGICKMLAIGLGKHTGAARLHHEGYGAFDRLILETGRTILATGRIAFGLAIIENAYEETAFIEALPADQVVAREPVLLEEARRLMPRLPLPEIDVLVVERFGKNISGIGMDPNVTGRGELGGPLPGFDGPRIERIVVLGLTPETAGNAHGIGLADLITERLLDEIDRKASWTNTLSAGSLACGRIPIALPTDDLVILAASRAVPAVQPEDVRMVRIRDTLHLSEFAASQNLLETIGSLERCEITGPWDGTWQFD